MGGFIAAKQPLIDIYLMQARQRLFSIALTIPDTAALLEAVTMLGESEHLVQKLWGNVDYLRKGFTDLGFDIGHSETPIIPVMLGKHLLFRSRCKVITALDPPLDLTFCSQLTALWELLQP